MYRALVVMGLLLVTQAGLAQSKKKALSDDVLDRVTAAGVTATVSQGIVNFTGEVPTANGLVSSNGTLSIQTAPFTGTTLGSLTLNGNAQQNLSSLININAVNSSINVLLNLNINIDSTVGSILQSNLTGKQP
jgi:hypothetical protein